MNPRRWTISAYRQSDESRSGVGKVVAGDEFRTYGESVRVREDTVLQDDVDAAVSWLRVYRDRGGITPENVRNFLSMVLGAPQR